jgi:hypothetical protein
VNRASTATGPAARTGGAAAAWTFKGTPTACATCHSGAHEPDLGLACERCHTTGERGFRSGTFSHSSTAFPLTGRHEAVPCRSCHGSRAPGAPAAQAPRQEPTPRDRGPAVPFKGRATACASCHADAHLGQAGTRCETCHTTQSFGVVSYTHAKLPSTFFSGQHAAAGCKACHTRQAESSAAGRSAAISFGGTGAGCASCHQEKDAHRGTLGSDCERCHTPERWPLISRAFHKAGLFPLEGRHLAVPCAGCHINGVTRGTPNTCYDCHWVRRQDDPNQTRLGTQCESCHRPTSWTAITWSHAERTGFSLGATHRTLGCESCHKDRRFLGGAMACSSCHLDEYQKALQPNHAAAGFPATCEVCHQPSHTSWTQAAFRHTSFPLIGAHGAQPCSNCHKANVYAGTPRDCVGCHTTAYQKATNPNHAAAGFPTACDQCHRTTVTTWKGAQFNHASFFALVGTHATQACVTCHANNVFRGTPRDCVGCHLTTYQKTSAPNHAAAGFPTSCAQCHQASSSGWRSGSFNHAGSFTLVGVHATQACTACHKSGTYKGTPRDCVGCHLATYQKTSAPNHAAAGFPTTCEQCHQASASSWGSGSFNHATAFALVGGHATQACTACHKSGTYKGTPRDCAGCHMARYQQTANPNHAAAGFPTTCEQCHQASAPGWTSSFNHNQVFPLLGRHLQQPCSACHKNNVYRGTSTACVACHQSTYERTANPNHAAAGFPTTCESCHKAGDSSWNQGVFNHTRFPITSGRHAGVTCATCHTTPNAYQVFSCVSGCHARASIEGEHREVTGFRYDSAACYACHPTGRGGQPRP